MKSVLWLLVCAVVSISVFAQGEAELVKKVKAKLDKINDYKASGRMNIDVSFINVPPSDIITYYKKPDRFKIKKTDGISILPKGGVSININSLLTEKDYAIVPAGTAMIEKLPVRVIKLLPSSDKSDIVLTTLYIDETNLIIKKAIVTTKDNGTYQIDMTFGKYIQAGLPDKIIFTFNTKEYKIPKGVTFEYEKGDKKEKDNKNNSQGKVEIIYNSYIINKGIEESIFNK
ncbi:MAG TPA: hypothetical protein VGO09_09455 [Flavisolibacter sp.]|nr:hypothetical protein [Flavisolibacter sp.]